MIVLWSVLLPLMLVVGVPFLWLLAGLFIEDVLGVDISGTRE